MIRHIVIILLFNNNIIMASSNNNLELSTISITLITLFNIVVKIITSIYKFIKNTRNKKTRRGLILLKNSKKAPKVLRVLDDYLLFITIFISVKEENKKNIEKNKKN